jgi:uncharacterized Zn-finger protein
MNLDKHIRCEICQQGFTRSDHLKRHYLRRMQTTLPTPVSKLTLVQILVRSHTSVYFAIKPLRDGELEIWAPVHSILS